MQASLLLFFMAILKFNLFGWAFTDEEVVCPGLDLRSDLGDALRVYKAVSSINNSLDRCTVIEGNVHLLLIGPSYFRNRTEYRAIRFARLREITGYLLIFEFSTLTSVGDFFPQLRIIRGLQLVQNYALIIYRNPNLVEIGLSQLREISRGGIRISNNPKLCYVDTVNWSLINKGGTVVIDNNKSLDLCGVCNSSHASEYECAKLSSKNTPACWNYSSCQKNIDSAVFFPNGINPTGCYSMTEVSSNLQFWNGCKPSQKTIGTRPYSITGIYTCHVQHGLCDAKSPCNDFRDGSLICCHPECRAGCTGPNASDCVACRNVLVNGICQKNCPAGQYIYLERRCLTFDQCRAVETTPFDHYGLKVSSSSVAADSPDENLSSALYLDEDEDDGPPTVYFKPIDSTSSCSPVCPQGYEEDPFDRHSCRKCPIEKGCTKICASTYLINEGVIYSVADAQRLKGCTVIRGHLDISIYSSLSGEVTDYIKVSFSKSLSSLDFFKNLRIIRGNTLWAGRFAFTVFQNKNLISLWNKSNDIQLRIFNGGVQFQNNPRLCMNRIQNFMLNIDFPPGADKDISPFSNSDVSECNTVKIDLAVGFTDRHVVILNWTPYEAGEFIGYKVYFRAVKDVNVDINVDRDSCGEQWAMNFVQNDLTQGLLRNLSADTLYAVYVQTATVHGRGHPVGISDVKYVRTKYEAPSAPRFVEQSSTKDQISLKWMEPEKPHGQITHYKISIAMKPLVPDDDADYCSKHSTYAEIPTLAADRSRNVESPFRVFHSPSASAHPVLFDSKSSIAAKILKLNSGNGETCSKQSCCYCEEEKRDKIDLDKNVELSIFEDRIHDVIFPSMSYGHESIRRRRKRSIKSNVNTPKASVFLRTDSVQPFNLSFHRDSSKNYDYRTFEPVFTFNASTSHMNFLNLYHFSLYEFRIWACQNRTVRRNYCSYEPLTLQVLTRHSVENDIIDSNTISIKRINRTSRLISWKTPPYPNGQILAFEIRYRRLDYNETSANLYTKCVPVVGSGISDHNLTLIDLSPAEYQFRIRAVTQANIVYWSEINFIVERLSTFDLLLIAFCGATFLLLVICALTTGYIYLKRRSFSTKYVMEFFSANPDYFSQMEVYNADEWELNRDEIELIREIGNGSFGKVYEGRAVSSPVKSQCGLSFTQCAIKTIANKADMLEKFRFLIEASVMKQFADAAFIVKLFGVVSEGYPTLVVMELMDRGNLKEYLMSRRPDPEYNTYGLNPPTYEETLKMAAEIADGMAYLEAHQFCHRDLAARNCLVAADGTCKIGDFGMTRNLYDRSYYKPSGRRLMPVRWMAPEALRDAIFTSKSDVWSYGVLLWEIVTLAQQPYAGLSNEEVFDFVVDLKRTMDRPTGCPFLFETLMRQCWQYEAKNRPTFEYFVSQLEPYQELSFHNVSYFCKSTRCLVGQLPECSENDYLLGVQQRKIAVTADRPS